MRFMISEFKKLKSSKALFIAFLLNVAFVFCVQLFAAKQGIAAKGFLFSNVMAFLNSLGLIIIHVGGALICYNDYSWNTQQHLLTGIHSRRQVIVFKLLTIAMGSVGVVTTLTLLTMSAHLMGGGPLDMFLPNQFVLQIGVTVLDLFLWGIVAYTITTLTKSMAIGFFIPFVISLFEILVYPYLSVGVRSFLPDYNIQSLLERSFSNLDSEALQGVVETGSKAGSLQHLIYIGLFIAVMIALVFVKNSKEEVGS